jgi:hypothetical protein
MVSVTLGWISGQVQKWGRNSQRVGWEGEVTLSPITASLACVQISLRSDRLLMSGGARIIIETGLVESRCETLSRNPREREQPCPH